MASDFVEMSLIRFLQLYPGFISCIPAGLSISDEDYIVRFSKSSGLVEIGYADDSWCLS